MAARYKGYGAVIFRKTSVQVMSEGGLWDTSEKIYPLVGARGTRGTKRWVFPNGSVISFLYLEHDNDRFNWQGAQIPYIGFDELTHFSERTFWYLVGRNRSMGDGPPPYQSNAAPRPRPLRGKDGGLVYRPRRLCHTRTRGRGSLESCAGENLQTAIKPKFRRC